MKVRDRTSTAELAIRAASTEMLQGKTQGDPEAFLSGIEQMADACVGAGYIEGQ